MAPARENHRPPGGSAEREMDSGPDKHGESGEPIPSSLKLRKMSNNGGRWGARPGLAPARRCSVFLGRPGDPAASLKVNEIELLHDEMRF